MAPNTLMSLLVRLGVSSGDFDKGMDAAEKKSHSTAGNIVSGMSKVGAGVAAGLAGAAIATGAFLASTIGPASDLNETVSKVGVVFGESAKEVLAFGKTAANALGMSENAALSAAGTYGNLFRAMGMTETTSAGMSTELVKLAGDLASFNNMDPTEVLDKLRAGLSGETEPLRSLGVNLNQALIEQQALSSGIWDGVAPINAAQKAQASYALIMEQTTLAQGDFARTSKGLANQQRIMAANFANLKVTLGTALLPAIVAISNLLSEAFSNPAVQAGIGAIVSKLTEFANWVVAQIPVVIAYFQNLSAWFSNNQPVIVGILAALGVALLAFGVTSAIAAATAIAPMLPVIAIIAAIGVAVGLLYAAWTTNWGGIQDKTAAVWAWLQGVWAGFQAALASLANYWTTVLLPALLTVYNFLSITVFPLFQAIGNFIGTVFTIAITALAGAWQNILLPALTAAWDWLTKLWSAVSERLAPALSTLSPIVQAVAGFFGTGFSNALSGILTFIGLVTDAIVAMTTALQNIKLPAALTPGSPTPFEMGLRGINDALKTVASTGLPTMQAQFSTTSEQGSAGGAGAMGGGIDYEEMGRVIARAMTSALARSEFA